MSQNRNLLFKKASISFRAIGTFVAIAFVGSIFLSNLPKQQSIPEASTVYNLPSPTEILPLSKEYSYPLLKGIRFDPKNPLNLEFIIDTTNESDVGEEEASRLVKYFLAGLTLPEKDLWVNLSPYEKTRVASDNLALTDLGKDMLNQDYVLKQLLSSLTYPESKVGRDYWQKTYQEIAKTIGTTNIPINTFNKVWIVPNKCVLYESGNAAFVKEASMKALIEQDYTALQGNQPSGNRQQVVDQNKVEKIISRIMKETVLPKVQDDINHGENFATLRQIYHSMVLAIWFKQKFKQSFYKYYINQEKVGGIDLEDKDVKEKIYNLYVEAYKKGVYDYIKKDYDVSGRKYLNRRYYSGGINVPTQETVDVIRIGELEKKVLELEQQGEYKKVKTLCAVYSETQHQKDDTLIDKAYKAGNFRRVDDDVIDEVSVLFRELGENGELIAQKLDDLRKQGGINLVLGIPHSHAGGKGIHIQVGDLHKVNKNYVRDKLIHEAIAGTIFGHSGKVHNLAIGVVEALNRDTAEARRVLNELEGFSFAEDGKVLWEMTQAERDGLVRDYANAAHKLENLTLSLEEVEKVDALFDEKIKKGLEKIYSNIKRGVSFRQVLEHFASEDTPIGEERLVHSTDEIVLDMLRDDSLYPEGIEVRFLRIRETNDWILIKCRETELYRRGISDVPGSMQPLFMPYKENQAAMHYYFDIDIHSHNDDQPLPNIRDLWECYSRSSGQQSLFLIKGRKGVTAINLTKAVGRVTDDDFKVILCNVVRDLQNMLTKREDETISPHEKTPRIFIEAALDQLEKHEDLLTRKFIPWSDFTLDHLKSRSFQLSDVLQSQDRGEQRLAAIAVLRVLSTQVNYDFKVAMFRKIIDVSDWKFQLQILDVLYRYFEPGQEMNNAYDLFLQLPSPIVQAVASLQGSSNALFDRHGTRKSRKVIDDEATVMADEFLTYKIKIMLSNSLSNSLTIAASLDEEDLAQIDRELLLQYLDRLTKAGISREGKQDVLVLCARHLREEWGLGDTEDKELSDPKVSQRENHDNKLEHIYKQNPNNVTAVLPWTTKEVVELFRKIDDDGQCPLASKLADKIELLLGSRDPLRSQGRYFSRDGKKIIRSRINIVRGIDRSHAGGMGINIMAREIRPIDEDEKYIKGTIIHEAVAGTIFGDSEKVHNLGLELERALINGRFGIAADLLNSLSGVAPHPSGRALWEMTQEQRNELGRDYASPNDIDDAGFGGLDLTADSFAIQIEGENENIESGESFYQDFDRLSLKDVFIEDISSSELAQSFFPNNN
ncbi:MAG: hypothetical protein GY858_00280 [Candidatus Omnitrophica bacterium]|nr:hypothetical protein [Candidatus Omnitrophota bacterium]